MALVLHVNGIEHTVDADSETPLLYVLRNDLKLKGAKYGCGAGFCGACMVIVDGKAVQACDIPAGAVVDKTITTIEGIAADDALHSLQQAFIAEQAAQCGYCIPGMIMSAKALLDANAAPTGSEILRALEHNICRCGTHTRILRAVRTVAQGHKP